MNKPEHQTVTVFRLVFHGKPFKAIKAAGMATWHVLDVKLILILIHQHDHLAMLRRMLPAKLSREELPSLPVRS
jgi:hypothetical protein